MSTSRAPRLPSDCADLDVIVVDDESPFRTSLTEILRDDGHRVRDYDRSSAVPVGVPRSRPTVLITDYDLAGLDGIQLADAFHATNPGAIVVVLSACRTAALEARLARRPFVRFLVKPVDYDLLHAAVHAVAE